MPVLGESCGNPRRSTGVTPITPFSSAGEYFVVEVAAEEDHISPPPEKIAKGDADAKEKAVKVEQLAQFEKWHEAKYVG